MTAGLREPPPAAAHASRAARLKGLALGVLTPAVVIGGFLAFIEAFDSGDLPFGPRLTFMVGVSIIASTLGYLSFQLAERWTWARRPWWRLGAFSTLLMFAPMGLVVWAGVSLVAPPGAGPRLADLPAFFLGSGVTTAFFCFVVAWFRRNAGAEQPAGAAPVRFLERLPLKLRGAEVWAVEAEDHYLRLHTSKGQDLILMRLADAIGELAGIEGMQVHRSWWVARDAIADARRGDGRATLKLRDGSEVPVSRTYAGALRERGWI